MTDGLIFAARARSFPAFQINLHALHVGRFAMEIIAPVRKELDDVSTYPLATCAHVGAVQFAERVFHAVRFAIPDSVQIQNADEEGIDFTSWYPTDELIERHFDRVARRIGRQRWPNVDRIVTECQRERSKALAMRDRSPSEHELATLVRSLQLGKGQRKTPLADRGRSWHRPAR